MLLIRQAHEQALQSIGPTMHLQADIVVASLSLQMLMASRKEKRQFPANGAWAAMT